MEKLYRVYGLERIAGIIHKSDVVFDITYWFDELAVKR
jgi:hypothetical protein